jgi:hypothetical protein
MTVLIYSGFISLRNANNEGPDDILYLSGINQPLVDAMQSRIRKKQVSVQYWLSACKLPPEQMKELWLQKVLGYADVKYNVAYSDYTGYLWTDEDLKIGGHDLLAELKTHVDQYLYMEIEVHE